MTPRLSLRHPAATFAAAALLLSASALAPVVDGASPATNTFSSAVMHFDPGSGTVTPGGGTPIAGFVPGSVFYYICWTPGDSETNTQATGSLEVAAAGTLAGTCTATRDVPVDPSGHGGPNIAKEAKLTGTLDPIAGKVTFHLVGKGVYLTHSDPGCQACPAFIYGVEHDLVVDGPADGADVVGDRAEGTATFKYTCKPVTDNASCLNAFSGTIAFSIQLLPALAGGSPAAGGGGGAGATAEPAGAGSTTDEAGGLDLPTAIALLILVALLVFAIWVQRSRANRNRAAVTPAPPLRPGRDDDDDEAFVDGTGRMFGTGSTRRPGASGPASTSPAPPPGDRSVRDVVDTVVGLAAEDTVSVDQEMEQEATDRMLATEHALEGDPKPED